MLGKLGLPELLVIGFVAVLIFGTGRSLISVKVWARYQEFQERDERWRELRREEVVVGVLVEGACFSTSLHELRGASCRQRYW